MSTSDFDLLREAETSAANYDLTTVDIIGRLTEWQALCGFEVSNAEEDKVEISFESLPKDMDSFVHDLYEFCPNLVEQGTGCIGEMVEMTGEVPKEMTDLVEGVDLDDDDAGLEILKRQLVRDREIVLWWD